MSWIDLLENPDFLQSLYPNASPALERIRLHEVVLHQDGPTMTLRIDLTEFPQHPPKKWNAESNTVQLHLQCLGVSQFETRGWGVDNVGTLTFERVDDAISLSLQSPACRIAASCAAIRVDRVTGYLNS